jgi:hypothetical protein
MSACLPIHLSKLSFNCCRRFQLSRGRLVPERDISSSSFRVFMRAQLRPPCPSNDHSVTRGKVDAPAFLVYANLDGNQVEVRERMNPSIRILTALTLLQTIAVMAVLISFFAVEGMAGAAATIKFDFLNQTDTYYDEGSIESLDGSSSFSITRAGRTAMKRTMIATP